MMKSKCCCCVIYCSYRCRFFVRQLTILWYVPYYRSHCSKRVQDTRVATGTCIQARQPPMCRCSVCSHQCCDVVPLALVRIT